METNATFPSTKKETLALLYVQSRDLSAVTPEEIAGMYDDAYIRIASKLKELEEERKKQRQSHNLNMF